MVTSEFQEHHVELLEIMEEPEHQHEQNTTFHANIASKENCLDQSVVTNCSINYR